MKFTSFALAALLGLSATPVAAGTLIVSGDATIAARTAQGLPGNIQFARNILGGGDAVSIYLYSTVTTFPNPPLGQQLATVYNGFAGVSASTFDAGITQGVLNGADLLVVLGRSNAFTASEVGLVKAFLTGGGNVLLAGDSANIAFTENANINGLLQGIGSTIRLNQATEGIGDQFATDSEILANPLTAGITSFGYGRTTTLSGGTTLFLNDSGNAFVASESIVAAAVPEPATWGLMIVGFGAVCVSLRRRRSATAWA